MKKLIEFILIYSKSILQRSLDMIFPESDFLQTLFGLSPDLLLIEAQEHEQDLPEYIFSLLNYHHPRVEKAIWELKYKGNGRIAEFFAEILYDLILETLSDGALFSNFINPILIPLPLSKERLRERGWNQSEMLAHELVRLDKNKNFRLDTKILIKVRHTLPQTKLSRKERLKNLTNCFSLSGKDEHEKEKTKGKIKNRNVILLDDVTTTGSTISEARKTLLQAGARDVIAFTIAH